MKRLVSFIVIAMTSLLMSLGLTIAPASANANWNIYGHFPNGCYYHFNYGEWDASLSLFSNEGDQGTSCAQFRMVITWKNLSQNQVVTDTGWKTVSSLFNRTLIWSSIGWELLTIDFKATGTIDHTAWGQIERCDCIV